MAASDVVSKNAVFLAVRQVHLEKPNETRIDHTPARWLRQVQMGSGDRACPRFASKVDVGTDGTDPGGAAVAVVARIFDVLDIGGVKHSTPRVPSVVAFDDILAAVVELTIAQQESKPPQAQIVLMIVLDSIAHEHQSQLVVGAMPAAESIVSSRFYGLVHLGVGKGFVLSLVPAEAAEGAQIFRKFLLGVVAESILECAKVLVKRDGRRLVNSRKISVDCLAIGAHEGAVGIKQDALGAFAGRDDAAAQFKFAVLTMGAAEGPIHIDSIGNDGHGEDAVANCPTLIVVFRHPAHGVATRVGGIIPCS